MAVFAYLALQLCRKGAKSIIEAGDRIYFKHGERSYFIEEAGVYWLMVEYTYQHNAPMIMNSAITYGKGQWDMIIMELDSPI